MDSFRRVSSGVRAVPMALALTMGATVGCGVGEDRERVTPYVALDREFSEPILDRFQEETGIAVDAKYDVESTKTVGLTNRILAEASRPVADLFWNNEIVNTIRLKQAGLLVPFEPAHAEAIPEMFKAKDGTWYGFASRARVLIINTELLPDASEWPTSIHDLADPKWKGKACIAKPLFGTTATHAACLFSKWGDDKAKQFFRDLKANDVGVLGGNRQVSIAVGAGQYPIGLTDTDDVMLELRERNPVAMVYPDREPDQLGTLFIPNTIGLIQGSRNPEAARALASYLLSPEVEASLAEGPSAQIPLLRTTEVSVRIETPQTVHAMEVDFEAAAARWDEVAEFIANEFPG